MFYRLHKGNQPQSKQNEMAQAKQPQERIKMDMKAFYKIIQAFIQTQQFENNIFMQCTKTCSNFDEENLEEKEKECLSNCYKKVEKYFAFIMREYKNDEGSLSEINSLLSKNSALLGESIK